MDHASRIEERLEVLHTLHTAGIYTVLFMSPIFPYITEWQELINRTSVYVDEYWIENLNLRGNYKKEILSYIEQKYPQYIEQYKDIFVKKKLDYWHDLAEQIN